MQKKMSQFMLLFLLVASVLWPLASMATEKPGQPLVIAVLLYSKNNLPGLDGLKAGLRERGYQEGSQVEFVFNGAVDRLEDLEPAMNQLMTRKPALVYAAPTPAAQVAKRFCQEKNIPVLFGPVNDAIGGGLVTERKHPGGNITGVMLADSEGKRLQLCTEIAPRIKTVLVPYNPHDKSSLLSLESVHEAATHLGLKVEEAAVVDQAAIDKLIAQLPEGIDTIFLPRDAMVMARVKDFAEVSIRKKIILSSTRVELVEKGALLGYGFDGFELGKQVARLADQIFKGKKPGDLPVETAEDYLSINLKTAQAIGLSIDDRFLRLAYRLIRVE